LGIEGKKWLIGALKCVARAAKVLVQGEALAEAGTGQLTKLPTERPTPASFNMRSTQRPMSCVIGTVLGGEDREQGTEGCGGVVKGQLRTRVSCKANDDSLRSAYS
jgi:hypothetical protein